MGTVGNTPPPPLPSRGPPPPVPPSRAQNTSLPTENEERGAKNQSILGKITKLFGKMAEIKTSITSTEEAKITAELNKLYGEGKNSFPLFDFARYGETGLRADDPTRAVYGAKIGTIFKEQKNAVLKDLGKISNTNTKNALLKRFDDDRKNIFVFYSNRIANAKTLEETKTLYDKFEAKANANVKTLTEVIAKVIKDEEHGKLPDHWWTVYTQENKGK